MTFTAALATATPAPARTRVIYLHANGTACESYACQLASHHDAADVDATHGLPLVAGADYAYAARPARRRACPPHTTGRLTMSHTTAAPARTICSQCVAEIEGVAESTIPLRDVALYGICDRCERWADSLREYAHA